MSTVLPRPFLRAMGWFAIAPACWAVALVAHLCGWSVGPWWWVFVIIFPMAFAHVAWMVHVHRLGRHVRAHGGRVCSRCGHPLIGVPASAPCAECGSMPSEVADRDRWERVFRLPN